MGKTLVFLFPALLIAVEEEMKMPILKGEGPFCLILLPSHELAIQTYEIVLEYIKLFEKYNFPELKAMLCIGGQNMGVQLN